MRIRSVAWIVLFTLSAAAVVMAASPLAQGKEVSKSIVTHRDAKVAGQVLAKGSYTVRFADDKEGELVLLQGKREVLKAPYRISQLTKPAAQTQVVLMASGDGTYRLTRIEFEGSVVALLLE